MHSNLTNKELEDYLSGGYPGKIYNVRKFMPVLNVLREKGEIPADLINRLLEHLNKTSFIYFNSKNTALFGLNFDLENAAKGLSLEIIKLQKSSEAEIRKFCAKLFELIAIKHIHILDDDDESEDSKMAKLVS